jgi:hypothetical protein
MDLPSERYLQTRGGPGAFIACSGLEKITEATLVEQSQQEGYRHQDGEDHGESEEAQPESFHLGCAPCQ